MAIYDIFETKETVQATDATPPIYSKKDRFFSSLTARTLFFFLLLADLLWGCYALSLLILGTVFAFLTFFKVPMFRKVVRKQWIALKRSSVCALSLFISLFSPALGIMIACTYFLMYDKTGIQEVVPTSLQDQFQDFFQTGK